MVLLDTHLPFSSASELGEVLAEMLFVCVSFGKEVVIPEGIQSLL